MRRITTAALLAMLTACGGRDEPVPAPTPTRTPEVTVETRPAVVRPNPAEAAARVELMLANANIPAAQVEAYARDNGVDVPPLRMAAKRDAERRREGLPKLLAGEEYIEADPNRDAVEDPARAAPADGGPEG